MRADAAAGGAGRPVLADAGDADGRDRGDDRPPMRQQPRPPRHPAGPGRPARQPARRTSAWVIGGAGRAGRAGGGRAGHRPGRWQSQHGQTRAADGAVPAWSARPRTRRAPSCAAQSSRRSPPAHPIETTTATSRHGAASRRRPQGTGRRAPDGQLPSLRRPGQGDRPDRPGRLSTRRTAAEQLHRGSVSGRRSRPSTATRPVDTVSTDPGGGRRPCRTGRPGHAFDLPGQPGAGADVRRARPQEDGDQRRCSNAGFDGERQAPGRPTTRTIGMVVGAEPGSAGKTLAKDPSDHESRDHRAGSDAEPDDSGTEPTPPARRHGRRRPGVDRTADAARP